MIADLTDQFSRQFATLDGVYDCADATAWNCHDQSLKGTWQWLAHILETIDFYISNTKIEDFAWGKRLGCEWEDHAASRIPSREDLRAYQDEVERKLMSAIEQITLAQFAAPETACPWTGKTYASKLLYLLRHTQQHIGDINRGLATHNCPVLKWH